MSVLVLCAQELKAVEIIARKWVNVEEDVFPALYVANHHAYSESYAKAGALSAGHVEALRREYAQATADPKTYTGDELLATLHRVTYNTVTNDGRGMLDDQGEAMRRRLVQSVAFEVLVEGGPWVKVADLGSVRRVNFDLYEISSRDPGEGHRARVYLMDGRPHRHEGYVTDRPWEAFERLWEMNDECYAHWLRGYERDLAEQARRLGIL